MTPLLILCCAALLQANGAENWPQFRGENGSATGQSTPPVVFGPATNLLWRIPIPGGNSSPVIWGEELFLTGFEGGVLKTIAYSRRTGAKLWEQTVKPDRVEPAHSLNGPAAPTPVTDGRNLIAYFGSFGLVAYDLGGKERWRKALPIPMVEFGSSSSPIIADGKLILLCDQDLNSFLLAIDPDTGKELWKIERLEFRRGFSTPFVWKHEKGVELVVPGSIYLKSYDLRTGVELWSYEGTARVANSSPTASATLLFSASWNIGGDSSDRVTMPAFAEFAAENDRDKDGVIRREEIADRTIRDRYTQMDLDKDDKVTEQEWSLMREMFEKGSNGLLAIRPGGRGVVNQTHLAWKVTRSLPYVSSPLFYKDRLYTVKNGGLVSCYEAETGKVLYQDERIGALGDYYSSPVGAGDRIYFASQHGVVTVIRAGRQLEVLARNDLGEQIFATPAISEGKLYYRTREALYCFGE